MAQKNTSKLWFPGHSVGLQNVFLHPCRGSKLEGPPFEGPGTSVQGPRGVGSGVGGTPSHRHKKDGWVGGMGMYGGALPHLHQLWQVFIEHLPIDNQRNV